jgi:hypothetical protein
MGSEPSWLGASMDLAAIGAGFERPGRDLKCLGVVQ